MIGVIANPSDNEVVEELFELFKTPWEWYRRGKEFDAVLCIGECNCGAIESQLILAFAAEPLECDRELGVLVTCDRSRSSTVCYENVQIPIYGVRAIFAHNGPNTLMDGASLRPVSYVHRYPWSVLVRVGYNLLDEVRILLTQGQPATNALIPTLDLHIRVLRNLLLGNGVPMVEIPPVPRGYNFIASLTHDIDHPLMRNHCFDRTMWGFIYRAILGSARDAVRRRVRIKDLARNWLSVLKLPFIHLGLAKDLWSGFDKYVEHEHGSQSSFFVIPFRGRAGWWGDRPAPAMRSASYDVRQIEPQLRKLINSGCDIGLHGIDAWRVGSHASEELEQLRRITGKQEIGVRMHWLYFNESSPAILEAAGADYDSSIGYNDAIGYRAGTTQAYRPLGAARLLELPLHVMDTALFFPKHMNLTPAQAWAAVTGLMDNAAQSGGCLTINWHDRSLAPERQWGDFYVALVQELRERGAWLASGSQAVSWFRRRRSVMFDPASGRGCEVVAAVHRKHRDEIPGLRMRKYRAQSSGAQKSAREGTEPIEYHFPDQNRWP
jgi:hypothetical protein